MATETRKYRTVGVNASASGGLLSRWGLLLLIVLVSGLAYVWLRSSAERSGRQLQTLRHEFSLRVKEVDNLRIEHETYKGGAYIGAAVTKFNLCLQPAKTGQVRRVSLRARPAGAPDESREASGLLARN